MPEGLDIHTDRKVYSIPEGLNELMYDISKEVLRCQPKNIYQFISDYLITLLKVREAVKVAVPLIESEFEIAQSQTNFLKILNLSKEQGDRFATIIQAAFRGYQTRKRLLHIADDIVKEEPLHIGSFSDDDPFHNDPVFSVLKTRGVTLEQTIEAATKIQAFYRGYKVRKLEQEKGVECLLHEIPSHESWRHDWLTEKIPKKSSGVEINRLRKEFADFHKHFSRQHEGDRLHIETIFGGKYEDYNWVCDQTSCQEFVIPTPKEAQELAVPGALEPSISDIQDIPGSRVMQSILNAKIKESSVSYDKADRERLFYESTATAQTKTAVEEKGIVDETTKTRVSQRTQSKISSVARLSKTPKSASVTSTPRSEGSKSKISKKSSSKVSVTAEGSAAPELSVRSLAEATEGDEVDKSEITALDEMSEVPSADEKTSIGSKKSRKSSKLSPVSGVGEQETISQTSKKSGDSGASRKSGSKKSLVEPVEEPLEQPPEQSIDQPSEIPPEAEQQEENADE